MKYRNRRKKALLEMKLIIKIYHQEGIKYLLSTNK